MTTFGFTEDMNTGLLGESPGLLTSIFRYSHCHIDYWMRCCLRLPRCYVCLLSRNINSQHFFLATLVFMNIWLQQLTENTVCVFKLQAKECEREKKFSAAFRGALEVGQACQAYYDMFRRWRKEDWESQVWKPRSSGKSFKSCVSVCVPWIIIWVTVWLELRPQRAHCWRIICCFLLLKFGQCVFGNRRK